MSTTSAPSPALSAPRPGPVLAGVAGRSTASVRTRYRRQTAALMVGTTVVGLWLGLAAPAVSPVAPDAPTDTRVLAPFTRGQDGFRGHHR